MWRILCLGGLILMSVTLAAAKSEPTYYTPERVAGGQANLQAGYDWAQAKWRRMMQGDPNNYYIGREYGSAEDCIAQTDDFIWLMQPTTLLRRKVPDHDTQALCPVHGDQVRKYNAWTAWTTDPIHHPYKVRCRAGGEWYPSNDYMNGDMTSGDYPDDGLGCVVNGKRYYFLIEYAHMAYGNNTIPCLRSLSQAWLLTGDKRYARKGCILLARLASEYPNFTDRRDRLYLGPYGGRDPHYKWKTGGVITDLIWETFCLEATVYAYDGLWNYMDQDPEMLAFLKSKGLPIETGDDLRHYIEEKLIRVGMEGLLNGHIRGNEGHHQAAALACALVMDDYDERHHPNSADLVEWAFHGAGRAAWVTINGLTTDGGGIESPNYNLIKLDFIRVNRLMEEIRRRQPGRFPVDRFPDLFGNPKGRAIFDHNIDIMIGEDLLPSIGDCGGLYTPPIRRRQPRVYSALAEQNLYAVERFGDPRHARACTTPDGTLAAGELFEPYPQQRIKELLQRPESQIERRPRLLDGYGVAIIENRPGPKHHALALNYSWLIGHRQYDNLNLEVWARGVDLMPDLGYPSSWEYRQEWDAATLAHNTVTVDQTNAAYGRGGACRLFASADGVHVVVASHDPYPASLFPAGRAAGVDLYERTTAMLEVAADAFYIVDLFAVRGGQEHTQSWHGPTTPVQLPALDWVPQPTGTLAGADVQPFASFTDRWGRTGRAFASFLSKIRRANLSKPATWTWDYGLPEGDKLDLHLIPVGSPLQIIVGTGSSPARPKDWGLDYVLARRDVTSGQVSHFLTVIAPYQNQPLVTAVELISAVPLTLRVTRADVRDEITLATPTAGSRRPGHRPLGIRVRTLRGDRCLRDIRLGEYGQADEPGYAYAVIRDTDYPGQRIRIADVGSRAADFAAGRYVRIYSAFRSAMYRVVKVERAGRDLWLTLDHTALLAQGPVVKTADGRLWLQAFLDWTLSSSVADGELLAQAGGDYFAGAWLGEGHRARRVRGAVRDMPSEVFFAEPVPAADLQADYGGQVVSLWQYGVGDRVEVPRVVVQR